jgi:hypothetical protein
LVIQDERKGWRSEARTDRHRNRPRPAGEALPEPAERFDDGEQDEMKQFLHLAAF